MDRLTKKLEWLKGIMFQFMFVIHHHSITNKHLLVLVELIQILPLVYFYINPLYSQLKRFYIFQTFFQTIWPQIFLYIPSQEFLLALVLLSIFPAILITLIIMKLIVGYQYLIIVAIQLILLVYPLFFVKFGIQTFNILINFKDQQVIGIIAVILHSVGSVLVLHMYEKKYKLLDLLPILLIYVKTSQYAVLAIVILRLVLSYFISPSTLIKPLRIRIQCALLLVILFAYFAADNLTNYIAFILLLSIFSMTQVLNIITNYDEYAHIFYHLQNLNEEESESRLRYYDFIQDHRINCQNVLCMCRQLGKFKTDEEIQSKAYEFVKNLYSFKEDFYSRIQLGDISCQKYQYTLSGLLLLLQLKPESIYQEYLLYYVKTKYEQEYRKNDKNYTFGQVYNNAYEDLRSFEERIQTLTRVLKEFWNTILYFDGSKKFLSLILNISEQITQIKEMYDLFVDKYEQFGSNFKYLYKTFEIAILNLLDKEKQEQSVFGVVKQDIQIKIPQRMLFFISNSDQKIVNCNREFCNLVEIDKEGLINKSYAGFVPQTCNEFHSQWVRDWYQQYNREQESKESIKVLKLSTEYMKAIKMQNKILPRFDKGIEVITFIKLINKLQESALHKTSSEAAPELNTDVDQSQIETFFSFLIERKTMKIVGMDDSFFYTTMIEESDDLRKKIQELRLNEIFPKLVMTQKDKDGATLVNESHREVMLNYSVLDEFQASKEKNNNNMISTIKTLKNNMTMIGNAKKTFGTQIDDERLSYARKTPRRNNAFSGGTIIGMGAITKENSEQIFLYEIINQANACHGVEYCIVNFKLKKNLVFQLEAKLKEQQEFLKTKTLKMTDGPKPFSNVDDEIEVEEEQNKLLAPKKQTNSANIFANLSHRQPFIRASKPYKEEDSKKEIETKKAELQESDEFTNEQKNYCLPWPILLSMFAVHFLYSHMSESYSNTFEYLQKTFDFYDKYEMQILKQLDVPFNGISYHQDLKSLWMQGYGFYHESILTFENPSDPYFIDKLYNDVIKEYHYGIYKQIQVSLDHKIQSVHMFLYVIMGLLSFFILYILIDFILNLRYCFRISGKVTQIILIFLNLSESDINQLIYSITKYQTEVLEMFNYADIEQQQKMEKQDYRIDDTENQQAAAEHSGIGLLKEQHYLFGLQNNLKNLDSQGNSPLKASMKIRESLQQNVRTSVQVVPKGMKQSRKRNESLLHKRRNSRAERIDLQKLKESISSIKSPPTEQTSEKKILLQAHQRRNDFMNKSGFRFNTPNLNTSFNSEFQANISGLTKNEKSPMKQSEPNFEIKPKQKESVKFAKSSIGNIIDKVQNDDSELSPDEESKLAKINNFKKRSRGKINDMRENPRSYILLVLVLILSVGSFVTAFVLIPEFIANFQKFSSVYFDLRKLKIVLFKGLIEKATKISLQPDVKSSVYSEYFYNEVIDKLDEFSDFQFFWKNVYSNDVCPYISDRTIKNSCLGLQDEMTSFGQKIMIQNLEDFIRRKNASELFHGNSTQANSFMIISRIQAALVSEGNINMNAQMFGYLQKVANLELIVAGAGTIIFVICLMMSHKALKDIRLKIKDGENLLLVMPDNIKKKYIEKMKKNRMKELAKELDGEDKKQKMKRKKSRRLESPPGKLSEGRSQTAVELIGNNSALIREQDRLLKGSLKNSSSLRNSKECLGSPTHNFKASKFKN